MCTKFARNGGKKQPSKWLKMAEIFGVNCNIWPQNSLSEVLHNQLFQYPGDVEMTSCCATVFSRIFSSIF